MKKKIMAGTLALILGVGISSLSDVCFAMDGEEGSVSLRAVKRAHDFLPEVRRTKRDISTVLDGRFLMTGYLKTKGNKSHWELELSLMVNNNHDEKSKLPFMAKRNDDTDDPYNLINNYGYIGLGNKNNLNRPVLRKILLFLKENGIRNVLVETTVSEEQHVLNFIGFKRITVAKADSYGCIPVNMMIDDGGDDEDNYHFMELTNLHINPLNF